MTATDQRGSLGGGENMIAMILSGSDVRTGEGVTGTPGVTSFGTSMMGGLVVLLLFRLWLSLLFLLLCVVGARSVVGRRSAGTMGVARPSAVSIMTPVARAANIDDTTMTARSMAHRYLRSRVSMDFRRESNSNAGAIDPANDTGTKSAT